MSTITASLGTYRALRLRAALTALLAAGVAVGAPFYFAPFQVFQLTMVLLYAAAPAGLNLLVGFGGQISLGHGAFFAAGAYTAAVMLDRYDTDHLATLPVAAVGCFLLGLGFGMPALRLRGLYLALLTLAFAVFLPPLLKRFEPVTGGSMGLTVDKLQPPAWSGLAEDQWTYFVVLAVTGVALLLARNLLRSRVGRALLAVRDNESAAEVMGVRLPLHKTLAFAWSVSKHPLAGEGLRGLPDPGHTVHGRRVGLPQQAEGAAALRRHRRLRLGYGRRPPVDHRLAAQLHRRSTGVRQIPEGGRRPRSPSSIRTTTSARICSADSRRPSPAAESRWSPRRATRSPSPPSPHR